MIVIIIIKCFMRF